MNFKFLNIISIMQSVNPRLDCGNKNSKILTSSSRNRYNTNSANKSIISKVHDDNNDNIKNDTDDININKHERITKKYNNFVLNILKFYKVLV